MTMAIRSLALTILCLSLNTAHASGRWLTTSFVQAYLPSDWNCNVKAKQWECRRTHSVKSREATILLSAKVAGPEDKLSTYHRYLSYPIKPPGRNSKPSKVLGVKKVKIHGQEWVDGYHLGSELPTWHSRYLATTKDGLAVLISFSNHSAKSSEYKVIFSKIVSSLRVNLQNPVKKSLAQRKTVPKAPIPVDHSSDHTIEDLPIDETAISQEYLFGFLILGGALLISLFLFLTKRKKKKR